jgi:hypothetical protein
MTHWEIKGNPEREFGPDDYPSPSELAQERTLDDEIRNRGVEAVFTEVFGPVEIGPDDIPF